MFKRDLIVSSCLGDFSTLNSEHNCEDLGPMFLEKIETCSLYTMCTHLGAQTFIINFMFLKVIGCIGKHESH